MKAGKLRYRITMIPPALVSDDWGVREVVPDALTDSDTGPDEVWADVRPTSGKKANTNDGVQATTEYAITIRYRSDITPSWRIGMSGKFLDILSAVDVDGLHEEIAIIAVESHA